MVTSHERSLEIAAPAAQVFAVVRDPAVFPRFLRGIAGATGLDDGSLEFRTDDPHARRWAAAVTEMVDGVSVGWTSREAPVHTGLITLEPLTAEMTRVTLRIDSDPGATPGDDPTADLDRLADLVGALPRAPGEPRLASVAGILDVTVTDALGEPIGSVRDAHIDLDGLTITSLAVNVGALDGAHLVPVAPIAIDEALRGIAVPYSADAVRSAPRIEPGTEPDAAQLAEAAGLLAAGAPGSEGLLSQEPAAPTPEIARIEEIERGRGDGGSAGVA